MAKKSKKAKKSKLIKIGVISVVAVLLLIGVVFLVGEVFVSPDIDKLTEVLNKKDDVVAFGIDLDEIVEEGATGCLVISDTTESVIPKIGTVVYFDSFSAAMDAAKELKETNENDDLKIRHRGNAVYYGSAECLALYNGVIF